MIFFKKDIEPGPLSNQIPDSRPRRVKIFSRKEFKRFRTGIGKVTVL